jgi:hypothetical protein
MHFGLLIPVGKTNQSPKIRIGASYLSNLYAAPIIYKTISYMSQLFPLVRRNKFRLIQQLFRMFVLYVSQERHAVPFSRFIQHAVKGIYMKNIAMNPTWWTWPAIFPLVPAIIPQIPLHICQSTLGYFADIGRDIINQNMAPDACGSIGVVNHQGKRSSIRREIGPNEVGIDIFTIAGEFCGDLELILFIRLETV